MLLGLGQINCSAIFSFYFYLGDLKSGGFTIDACHSMVALMDVSSCDIHCEVSFFLHLSHVFAYTGDSHSNCSYIKVHMPKRACPLDGFTHMNGFKCQTKNFIGTTPTFLIAVLNVVIMLALYCTACGNARKSSYFGKM